LPFDNIILMKASPNHRYIFFVSKNSNDKENIYFVNGIYDRNTKTCNAFFYEPGLDEITNAEFSSDGKFLIAADAQKVRTWPLTFQ